MSSSEQPSTTTSTTLLVRLKAYEPRRGHVLRRFTYAGVKFHEERGWYRVEARVAAHLKGVRQVPDDAFAPPAFDVCTEEEAMALDVAEADEARVRRTAADQIRLTPARTSSVLTSADLPKPTPSEERPRGRAKREPEA